MLLARDARKIARSKSRVMVRHYANFWNYSEIIAFPTEC